MATNSTEEVFAKVFSFLVGVPLCIIAKGFVLSIVWKWFIVPVFHAPYLTIPFAIGLSIVISAATPVPKTEDSNEWYVTMAASIIGPFLLLGFAWIVHLFC